jgi:hypothetical protein
VSSVTSFFSNLGTEHWAVIGVIILAGVLLLANVASLKFNASV